MIVSQGLRHTLALTSKIEEHVLLQKIPELIFMEVTVFGAQLASVRLEAKTNVSQESFLKHMASLDGKGAFVVREFVNGFYF